jgi:5,10-methylenetetrahydromethanopterin reductase
VADALRGKRLGLALWGTEPVAALARHAALAEAIGFDSVWIIDSQLLCREVTVTLAALLAATSKLKVATGVTQPITRHPSVTASAMATLAEQFGPRAILGIGTGFSSLRTIGLPQARVAAVEDYVTTVRRLLRGEAAEFGDVQGRLSWLDAPAEVPIVIAATGPRVMRTAARIADGAILHHGLSPDLLGRALGWIAEGAAEAGHVRDAVEVSCWAPYSLAEDPAEARDRVRARVAGALANVRPDWFSGVEREAVERLQAGYDVDHHASSAPDHAGMVPDSLVERYALAGSPEQVRAQFGRLLDQPGIDRIILTPQVIGGGARPLGEVLRDFETDVLARL